MNVKELVRGVPVPAAGVALGVVSLGNLAAPLGEWIHVLCAVVAACLVLLVIAKAVFFTKMVQEDLRNPVVAGTSGTFFMALMQLSTVLAPVAYAPAFALWCIAVLGHVALIVWFTAHFIFHFDLKKVFATYFVAYVGIAVAAVTSPSFGMEPVGRILFWFAFACYIVLLVTVTTRYAKHEVPDAAKPTFCIYSAPASLSITAYLSVMEEPNLVFVGALAVIAQCMFVAALTQLPKFLRLPFYPSYAAMTFPFVITATAAGKVLACFANSGIVLHDALYAIAAVEEAFAAVMVIYVLVRYCMLFASKLATPSVQRSKATASAR